jgi:hypothetical protein
MIPEMEIPDSNMPEQKPEDWVASLESVSWNPILLIHSSAVRDADHSTAKHNSAEARS